MIEEIDKEILKHMPRAFQIFYNFYSQEVRPKTRKKKK
jgi:hypothetical protein